MCIFSCTTRTVSKTFLRTIQTKKKLLIMNGIGHRYNTQMKNVFQFLEIVSAWSFRKSFFHNGSSRHMMIFQWYVILQSWLIITQYFEAVFGGIIFAVLFFGHFMVITFRCGDIKRNVCFCCQGHSIHVSLLPFLLNWKQIDLLCEVRLKEP